MILWYKIVGLIELWVCCLWRVNRITHFVIGGCFIVCLRGCCCATELCFGRMKDPFFFLTVTCSVPNASVGQESDGENRLIVQR
jgi:hypothetical protein